MNPDAIVIGAGLSGLTSAVRLAEAGRKVIVLAKGSGALTLAPATIDVLGYGSGGQVVDDPIRAALLKAAPHPYSRVAPSTVEDALAWLPDAVARGPLSGYRYEGSGARNLLLPTALGAVKPSALAPASIAAGDVRGTPKVLVVGVDGMKDFHPALIADNLSAGAYAVSARAATLPRPNGLALEPGALNLARFLDREANAQALAERLRELVRDDEAIAVPAMLGLKRPGQTWQILRDSLKRTIYEIPTLPPSVPGMRLLDVLKTLLRQAGGQFINNAVVTGCRVEDEAIAAITVRISGHERTYSAPQYVIATGGVASGAVALGSDWVTREMALGLEIDNAPRPGQRRFGDDYLGRHPIAQAGIGVDGALRPRLAGTVLANARVVGASLGGAEPWREKSGDGISLVTGYAAATLALDAFDRKAVPA
ncbi:MAG TPA: anaerobic glycerol-3-phosphate dehydrogenase subunit GlpB [Baekduia sp.]|nr:anaerobic glycerol-3-phosphate dehydrogenase subunit GlpB [Baekduia sp.]